MSLTNVQTASAGTAATVNLALTDGSGNNRKVLGFAMQDRNTVDITSMTFNGVTGTQVAAISDGSNFSRVLCFEWADAALPASGGTYALATNGSGIGRSVAGISASSAKQSTYATPYTQASSGTTMGTTLTADAGSYALICADATNTLTTGAGQTNILAPVVANADSHATSYKTSDFTVAYTVVAGGYVVLAVALEPAAAANATFPALESIDRGMNRGMH